MTLTIHLPACWPWLLACAGCFVAGAVVGRWLLHLAVSAAIGRAMGW